MIKYDTVITQEQINHVTKVIVDNYHPEKIILFGSYAKGTQTEHSDLDIAVIKDSHLPQHHRTREIRKYLRGLCIPMDIIVYTKSEIEEWKDVKQAFITHIIQTGKVVYENK